MTQSDLALMFGAGALAIAGGVQKRNMKPGVEQTSESDVDLDDASVEPAALGVDRSLANATDPFGAAPARPTLGQPAFGQPASGQPASGQPVLAQPVRGEPVLG